MSTATHAAPKGLTSRLVPTVVRQSHGLQRFMLLLGFGALGFSMRRRNSATPRIKYNFA